MAMSSSATQAVEVQKHENTANNAAAAPRKRRRRAPATGASEDCFACKKRQIKCDRRRPYCGQCVEMGKECSGYRTTLTWGVGVASRGKLRGMSLPVPKSPTQTSSSNTSKTQASNSSTSTSSTQKKPATATTENTHNMDLGVRSPTSPASPPMYSAPQEYLHLGPTSPIPIPSPTTPMGFHVPGSGYREHMAGYHPHSSKLRQPQVHRGPLQRLHTSLAVPFEENGLSTSTGSLISDNGYPSPSEFPQTPDDFPFPESSLPPYNPFSFHDHTPMGSAESFHFHEAPRFFSVPDDMSSSISSDQSVQDAAEVSAAHHGPMGPAGFPDVFVEGELSSSVNGSMHQPGYAYLPTEGMSSIASSTSTGVVVVSSSSNVPPLTSSLPQSLFPASCLSPRMQFLLDYYDKFICQVLVAFDSPMNPYRMHVMHLAMGSEGLRNAIAALATNNMRMRGGIDGRRLSVSQDGRMLPDHAFFQMTAQELREMHGQPTSEELHYKSKSIVLLNQQLADPNGAQNDSVLATLLILCLFHVCDSGFAKFKTQLAGVQKLLSMRNRNVHSSFVGWIELFFTWFDVMTSTVNDRETEVQGDSLDMTNLTANLGALEHLAGCEGRLFKLIARLGRLNLLSQNRPVREDSTTPVQAPLPRYPPARERKQSKDFYSLDFGNLNGNGWRSAGTSPISEVPPTVSTQDPSNRTPNNTAENIQTTNDTHSNPATTSNSSFWTEYYDIRNRLQGWSFPITTPTSSASSTALLHISESFRYSALLYTERLASSLSPSNTPSSSSFQHLVAQGLYHISQIPVTSCVNKFLLWPLFIIGSECEREEDRAVVRMRCVEIGRESGFFNNLRGLEVLEKMWFEEKGERRDSVKGGRMGAAGCRQAFRWRKGMDRVDGEYIVI
ncbi:hypothetical protein GQ43DRAFT_290702 [Delitschia confertaspora ATCC 74209]|uniref:Zn(2)-C6 fungal-type domain-containing protein n=1 Tax=Delitschia confertaspora ATCC 74209 TaxID=1513339 RepID=A0A9P4JGA2_9PLEO|nr:hypothetical protein GQ43DRAFT_290702 [Delitschia confertaspora ATCC 74209]